MTVVRDGIDDGSQWSDSKSAGEEQHIMTVEFIDGPRRAEWATNTDRITGLKLSDGVRHAADCSNGMSEGALG